MKANCRQTSAWVALSLLALAAPAVWAEGGPRAVNAGPMDLAAVKVFESGIDLTPRVRYERAVLTVSGMGQTIVREFDKYTRPSIEPFAPSGDLLADGTYTWSLSLLPDEAAARKLRESARANGGDAERPWLPKTGVFTVVGGSIVSPDLIEAGAAERARREHTHRAAHRHEVAAREMGGQVFDAQKAGRSASPDSDEMASAGGESALKAARAGDPRGAAGEPVAIQTGLDSDHRAAEMGASAERVLVPAVKAHELSRGVPDPSTDGANGRPRSDR